MGSKMGIVGFDRLIRSSWLDLTAEWAAQELSAAEIRDRLDGVLEGHVAGEGPHSARGKTKTVLLHVWVTVPQAAVALRDEGLELLGDEHPMDLRSLHWGMCLATYPFFRDVAAITGRLLSLQGSFTLALVTRRIAERWGERSTVMRASQRVVRSLVEWSVLSETGQRGAFRGGDVIPVPNGSPTGAWLVEAAILGSGRQSMPLGSVTCHPMLFPFGMAVTARDVIGRRRLELYRQGLGEDVVVLR